LDISEHGMYGYPEQFIPQPEYSTGLQFGNAPPPAGAPAAAVSPMSTTES
jgi:Amt family ammonium transporter